MKHLKKHRAWISKRVGARLRKRVAVAFARKHHLVYFHQVDPEDRNIPVILGTTASSDYRDANVCIGSHAGYDVVLLERDSSVEFKGYETTYHRWYILQIDLKRTTNLPFIFVGTKQQGKAYYARLLSMDANLHYLMLETDVPNNVAFHSHYAVIAELLSLETVSRIFHDDIVSTMGHHLYPFAIEMQGDSLILTTEAKKTESAAHGQAAAFRSVVRQRSR